MAFDLSKYKSTKECGPDKQSKKYFYYGPPEAGKTTLTKGLIEEGVFLISSERGSSSLADYDIPTQEVSNIEECIEMVRKIINEDKGETIKHIVIDSLSDLLGRDVAAGSGDGRKVYGTMFAKFQKLMLLFEGQNAPTFWGISHQEDEKKYTSSENFILTGKVMPSLPGSASWNKIQYEFDLIMRLTVIDGVRKLQCRDSDKGWAKDRTGLLDKWEEADLGHVLKKLRGGKIEEDAT